MGVKYHRRFFHTDGFFIINNNTRSPSFLRPNIVIVIVDKPISIKQAPVVGICCSKKTDMFYYRRMFLINKMATIIVQIQLPTVCILFIDYVYKHW